MALPGAFGLPAKQEGESRMMGNHQVAVLRGERGSNVRHKGRKSFSAFVKQMWGWGYHVGYPYAKTNRRGIYLYWLDTSIVFGPASSKISLSCKRT